jgi:uncharacterized protein YndB with AHSA1/START domain
MTETPNEPHLQQTGRPATRSAEGEVTVDASLDRVWQALTDARDLERWFPLDARVEPGPGGTIWMSWRNEFAADMKILVWDPPHHLRTGWAFHEGEATAQVTDYLIEAKGGKTVVRVVTSGFPADPSWDGWVEGTQRGWAFELRSLQHYLERHRDEPRHVAYVRLRVPLSKEQVWSRLVASGGELRHLLSGGQSFDERPLGQYTAILQDPADAWFRLSVEPGGPATEQREVVVFMSAWGAQKQRIAEVQDEWTRLLQLVFPEGTAP